MNPIRSAGRAIATMFSIGIVFGIVAADAVAATRTEIKQIIIEEAQRSTVPPALALAVAKVESDFQDRVESHKGARGVMQIMPKTARDVFGVAADELWDPRLNVQLGIDYLEQLYEMYGRRWELALSHYNGGTLKGGPGANATPHGYTRKYVADVTRWWGRYGEQQKVWGTMIADAGTVQPAAAAPASAAAVGDGYVAARTKPVPLETIEVAEARQVGGEADPKRNDASRVELHYSTIDTRDPTGTQRQPTVVHAPGLVADERQVVLAPDTVLADGGQVPEFGPPVVPEQSYAEVHWSPARVQEAMAPAGVDRRFGGGFAERLARARRSLDDFAELRYRRRRL